MPCKDKETQKISARKHYLSHKVEMKARARVFTKKAIERNKKHILDYLRKHPCIDCGINNVIVLEFDHRDRKNKYKEVTLLAGNGASIDKIQKEIDKCDVRCANCHRIKTAKEVGSYRI